MLVLSNAGQLIDKTALSNNIASIIHRFFGPEKVVIHIPVEILKSLNDTSKYATTANSFPYKFELENVHASLGDHATEGLNTGETIVNPIAFKVAHMMEDSKQHSTLSGGYSAGKNSITLKSKEEGKYFTLENNQLKEVVYEDVLKHYQGSKNDQSMSPHVKREHVVYDHGVSGPSAPAPTFATHKPVNSVKPIPVYKLLGYKLGDSNIGALEVIEVSKTPKLTKGVSVVDFSNLKIKSTENSMVKHPNNAQTTPLNSYGQKSNVQWKLPMVTTNQHDSNLGWNIMAKAIQAIQNHEHHNNYQIVKAQNQNSQNNNKPPSVHIHYEQPSGSYQPASYPNNNNNNNNNYNNNGANIVSNNGFTSPAANVNPHNNYQSQQKLTPISSHTAPAATGPSSNNFVQYNQHQQNGNKNYNGPQSAPLISGPTGPAAPYESNNNIHQNNNNYNPVVTFASNNALQNNINYNQHKASIIGPSAPTATYTSNNVHQNNNNYNRVPDNNNNQYNAPTNGYTAPTVAYESNNGYTNNNNNNNNNNYIREPTVEYVAPISNRAPENNNNNYNRAPIVEHTASSFNRAPENYNTQYAPVSTIESNNGYLNNNNNNYNRGTVAEHNAPAVNPTTSVAYEQTNTHQSNAHQNSHTFNRVSDKNTPNYGYPALPIHTDVNSVYQAVSQQNQNTNKNNLPVHSQELSTSYGVPSDDKWSVPISSSGYNEKLTPSFVTPSTIRYANQHSFQPSNGDKPDNQAATYNSFTSDNSDSNYHTIPLEISKDNGHVQEQYSQQIDVPEIKYSSLEEAKLAQEQSGEFYPSNGVHTYPRITDAVKDTEKVLVIIAGKNGNGKTETSYNGNYNNADETQLSGNTYNLPDDLNNDYAYAAFPPNDNGHSESKRISEQVSAVDRKKRKPVNTSVQTSVRSKNAAGIKEVLKEVENEKKSGTSIQRFTRRNLTRSAGVIKNGRLSTEFDQAAHGSKAHETTFIDDQSVAKPLKTLLNTNGER
jgi:hypothetical protein